MTQTASSHSPHQAQADRRRRRKRPLPSVPLIEPLEQRQLLAATLVDATLNSPVNEGAVARISATVADALSGPFEARVDWGDGSPQQVFPFGVGTSAFEMAYVYRDNGPVPGLSGHFNVTLTIVPQTGAPTSLTRVMTVHNVAPVITRLAPIRLHVPAGQPVVIEGSFSDPGADDTHTLSIAWGDGQLSTQPIPAGQRTFTASHVYSHAPGATAPETFSILATITDDDLASHQATTQVTLHHILMSLDNVQATDVPEGSFATLSGTLTDPLAPHTYTLRIDWGDGQVQSVPISAGPFVFTHRYLNNDPTQAVPNVFPIGLLVTDNDGNTAAATASARVSNVAPVLSIGDDVTLVPGQALARTGFFTDPGADTWTATVDYDDGLGPRPLELAADKSFQLAWQYDTPGRRTISVVVSDSDGESDSRSFTVAVISPADVRNVIFNNKQKQRSMVNLITVVFNGPVTLEPGAIQVRNAANKAVKLRLSTRQAGARTAVDIRFTGAGIVNGSLPDGRYILRVVGQRVRDALGFTGADFSAAFHRLYGDANGNGVIDAADARLFARALNRPAQYVAWLDFNGDGRIDAKDELEFQRRRR